MISCNELFIALYILSDNAGAHAAECYAHEKILIQLIIFLS